MQYIFAGKRLDNGDVVTGNLCQLKDGIFIMPQDGYGDYPLDYHQQGMGCGLEDRGIHDRYEAMRHGWDCGVEQLTEITPPLIAVDPVTVVRILGMDSEPAPGVELDWRTIEPLRRWEADYNNTLCAVIDRWEYGYVSSVFANGNNTQDIKESAPVSRNWDEACAWCEAQIIKIVTQSPKP